MSSRSNQRNRNRVTIAEVARHAGVSTATVSRVLNKTAPVSTDIIVRVKSAVAELNYRPHAAAQVLASQRTQTFLLSLSIGDA